VVHWVYLILAFIGGFASCYVVLWYLAKAYGQVIEAIEGWGRSHERMADRSWRSKRAEAIKPVIGGEHIYDWGCHARDTANQRIRSNYTEP